VSDYGPRTDGINRTSRHHLDSLLLWIQIEARIGIADRFPDRM